MSKKNPSCRRVSYIKDGQFQARPFIRLQGRWLEDAGFGIGSLFIAEVNENKIVLLKKIDYA